MNDERSAKTLNLVRNSVNSVRAICGSFTQMSLLVAFAAIISFAPGGVWAQQIAPVTADTREGETPGQPWVTEERYSKLFKDVEATKQLATSGDQYAQLVMGVIEVTAASPNHAEGIRWLELSAAQQNFHAKYQLSQMFLNGIGTNQDVKRGIELLVSAAELGSNDASIALATAYVAGKHVKQSDTEAFKWFMHGAMRNHAESQYYVALAFLNAKGVERDLKRYVEWLEKAAQHEHAGALTELGTAYLVGNGLSRDVDRAVDCLKRASRGNSVMAMNLLGAIYSRGMSGNVDMKEALVWFEKAAAIGSPEADANIGTIYALGLGVPPDYSKASVKLDAAIDAGYEPAKQMRERMKKDGTYREPHKR